MKLDHMFHGLGDADGQAVFVWNKSKFLNVALQPRTSLDARRCG